MTNRWESDWVCKEGYIEITANMGIDKTGEGGDVMIDLCADEIEPFRGEDIDELSSRHLEEIIKYHPEKIYDFYTEKDNEEGLNASGIKTTPSHNSLYVHLDKDSIIKCFKDDNCWIQYYIPYD